MLTRRHATQPRKLFFAHVGGPERLIFRKLENVCQQFADSPQEWLRLSAESSGICPNVSSRASSASALLSSALQSVSGNPLRESSRLLGGWSLRYVFVHELCHMVEMNSFAPCRRRYRSEPLAQPQLVPQCLRAVRCVPHDGVLPSKYSNALNTSSSCALPAAVFAAARGVWLSRLGRGDSSHSSAARATIQSLPAGLWGLFLTSVGQRLRAAIAWLAR